MKQEFQVDFSGGLNTRQPPHLIGDNQLAELQNVDLSFGDLRGEYGAKVTGQTSFFYEEAGQWVSSDGFTSDIVIIDWPYATTSSDTTTISTNTNYFSGSPNAVIGDGRTIIIGDGVTVTFYPTTQGIEGANSFVEYNEDLFIGRSNFTVSASISDETSSLSTGTSTYKFQVGDIVSNTSYLNEGTFVRTINTSASTVTLSAPAFATATSQNFTIKPIITKYLDGDTINSYRVGSSRPDPTIEYSQITGQTRTSATGAGHSATWYGTTDPIPFQYAVSAFDQTGVESRVSPFTDSNIGTVGGTKFGIASNDNDDPQSITINGVTRSTSSDTANADGRFALYRVGGTSSVTKRLDNLLLDSSLAITTSVSTNNLTVSFSSAKDGVLYKVKWYVYASGTDYRYNGATGYNNPFSSGTDSSRAYRGETEYLNPESGSLSFLLTGNSADHYVDLIVFAKIPGEKVEREYVCRALNHNNSAISSSANGKDYIDFQKADALIDIQPIEVTITPEASVEGLIENANLFFAFKGSRLYVSDYGNPNSWPETGFIDFDQAITGLGTLGSELVVFTEYGIHRVFGTDPTNLKKVEIPSTDGVKAGASKTITKFQGGLLYASLNGICFYNGRGVQRITQNLLSSFSLPHATAANNSGGYYNDVYYLLGTSGTGYKIDLKSGVKLSRTTLTAANLFFKASDNTLYADTGKIGDPTGTRNNFTLTTRKFTGGDINLEKIFFSVKITAQNFTGTINVLVDGTQTDTYSISGEVTDLDRAFYLGAPRQGNGIQVQLSNCTGEVNRIIVNYETQPDVSESIYDSVKIRYIGTPTVKVTLDDTEKISATALSSPSGAMGEATLYFSSMSRGLVPHLIETQNEVNGRVIDFSYSSTPV